ncbi:hypothetical protein BDZ97DRAFT_1764643, partial [Flammula alnicola]
MSKKATKITKEVRQYETGDPVLGKVVDPADAPPAVLNQQPPGKKAICYCVLFFPMGDYAWLPAKEMSSLKRHEIEAFLADDTKKRSGDLREGYKIALDPQPWMTNRAEIAQAAQEAEENAQVDQLESEPDGEEEGGSTKKVKALTSKKRKRESEIEPAKVAKKTPKAKKGSAEPAKRKSSSTGPKTKKNGAKSKTLVESEDEGEPAEAEDEGEDEGLSKKTSPPPAKKAKRDKDDDGDDSKGSGDPQSLKVRDWRHRLQKTFLSNKSLPKSEAMDEIHELFTTVEKYDEMSIEQLQFSKIGKVMRHIAALPEEKIPPRDEEFKFRARAKGLVDKWHQILNANKPANGSPSASAAGQTNGKSEKTAEQSKDEDEVTQGTKTLDLNGK